MKERGKRSFHGTEIMNGNACLGVSEIKILLKKKKKTCTLGLGRNGTTQYS